MTTTRLLTMTLTAAVLMVCAAATTAAQPSTPRARLAAARTLTCTFPVVATGTWKEGTAEAASGPATLKVAFANINIDEGTADLEGSFGGSFFIALRHSNDYLHLMQMHGAGPLYTTTVLAKESKDGRLMAVHTRHEFTDVRLPGYTSRPEMYVGDCAVGGEP
jgi:hypothetical protein